MAGGANDDGEDEITGINVTPLVDIVLVLLIIFMMTASYIVTPSIKVDLPRAASAEPSVQTPLALVITREGRVFLNNAPVGDDDIRRAVRAEKAKGKELEVIVGADRTVSHGRWVELIDLLKSEGVVSFGINTQADFTAPVAPPKEEEQPK